MSPSILAIDQGTTSSRAVLFDANFQSIGSCQQEFPQHYPNSGWVEHNPEDLWNSVLATCRSAIDESGTEASEIAAIGITNQRETVLVWDRKTGKCIYNAIVWQDRRTADRCATLKEAGRESLVTAKTGLLLDPYFSATKIAWILENVEGARDLADKGDLAFGTVDTFLLWRLSGGKFHATDATTPHGLHYLISIVGNGMTNCLNCSPSPKACCLGFWIALRILAKQNRVYLEMPFQYGG